jgi:hypothetical protein
MPRILTKLKITEVSAVDRGAGEGVRILLMKRADDEPQARSFNAIMAKADVADDGADDAGDRSDENTLADDSIVRLATLLVVSGGQPDLSSALYFLLHKPAGQALLARMHKAAETAKETTMPTTETLESILKDLGSVSFCKAIVDRGRAPCTESELVAVLSKNAAEQFNMPGDRAFAKLHAAEILVRQACVIAKAGEFSVFGRGAYTKADPAPNTDTAYATLLAKAEAHRDAHPELSVAQCFEKIYTDRANIELAKRERVESAPR